MNISESRRKFLVTKLAAGFALAVSPITAETIVTNADGLTAGEGEKPHRRWRRDSWLPRHAGNG